MPKTVYLFVFDGLADWEPGYAIAGIHAHAFQRAPGRYVVRTAATDGHAITTAGGVRIQPDAALDAVTPEGSAMLILPGGDKWDEGGNAEAVGLASRFLAAGVPVAAICGATAGLARAGLLDDKAHTSNMREYLAATGYAGAAHYVDKAAVTDGNLITAPGTAPIDFARAIFERLDLFTPTVVDAWYGLFTTRNPEYFARLMKEVDPASAQGGSTGPANRNDSLRGREARGTV
jgi:putative intracellular protease/amidase